jgi:hypothetical protein
VANTRDRKDKHPGGVGLRWLGASWLPDVPARDLSAAEVEACLYTVEELIASGAYEPMTGPAPEPPTPQIEEAPADGTRT